MSRMRKAIARNLVASKQTIPHFYMKTTIEADALLAFQKAEKAHYRCSVNDVITLAVARLLMEFPAFRSQVSGDDIVEYPDANIGIAVGMDEGLVVPVLKAADTRNLKGIAAETRRLVEAARAGKVEGMGEGVFTISNLGMFGVEEFSAIINPPESAILAVGAAREEVVVHHGAFRAGHRLTLSLSADHRVIDGLLAARFMARLKELLESPEAI
jgi:pyruvate dehydrogenase E2 component (dihydrolipoamide acetyltransferase)